MGRAVPPPRRGFTLLELLVVMAVIVLLAGTMLPALARARGAARRTSCASNLKQIGVAFSVYGNAFDDFYPCAPDPVSASPFYWLWMGRGWRGALEPFFNQKIDPDNPSVLYCKADPAPREKYESTSYAYSMCFYHTPQQINSLTQTKSTYSDPLPSVGVRAGGVADTAHKILAGEWTSNHQPVPNDTGWWTWDGARNFLLADGHAAYLPARAIHPANDALPNPCLTVDGVQGDDIE